VVDAPELPRPRPEAFDAGADPDWAALIAATRSLFFSPEVPDSPMSWATFLSSGMRIADRPPRGVPLPALWSTSGAMLIVSVT
jgi:hypothetical protein